MAYSTINKSTDHFTTTIWTGDSTTPKTFTTGTFKPDFLWGKNRSQNYSHQLYDTTRGAGNNKEIVSNNNGAEGGSNPETYGYVSAFTSTGFTATRGTDSAGDDYWNESPDTYVAWSWKANGGTTSSNSNGSITSTVQANTTAGFSIVKYTGTGYNATVGHGLGVAPGMILFKNLSSGRNWIVYHKGRGATKNLYLDMNNSVNTASDTFNNTSPTSTVFSIGTSVGVNESGDDIVAYCFTDIRGYLKTGVYYGNTVAGDPYVHLGFKPTFLLIKNSDATQNWRIIDNKRLGYNPKNNPLFPSVNNSEGTGETTVDLLSTGFRVMGTGEAVNGNGHRHIYLAIGQTLVGSNNIACTAR